MGFYTKQEVPYSLTGDGSSNNGSNNSSNVELITLNATENKTYNAPNNKAYNKVIINVPNAFNLGDNFNDICYDITGKIFYYDPTRQSDRSDDYVETITSFNSSTRILSFDIPEEGELSIDDLDGWYIVKGKTLLDTITSNISGFPNPNSMSDELEEPIVSGEQYIDVIMQCPVKINNTEIYLIHIFKDEFIEEEHEEPEEPVITVEPEE